MHVILDCYDVSESVCLDDRRLLEAIVSAAQLHGATIINTSRYRFGYDSPPGCTVFVLLDESHISAHAYADERKMAIDVFACGDTNAQAIADRLRADLGVEEFEQQSLERF